MKIITKSEWTRVLLLAVITLFIVMAPTVYGWLQSDTEHIYTGLHMLSPIDYPVYYTYINQVKEGHATFIDLFTNEPHARVIINPFWAALGIIARLLHLSAPLTLHLARVILIPVAVMTLYRFVSHLLPNLRQRLGATIAILTSSGVGFWITPFIGTVPGARWGEHRASADMWIAEANTFLTLLHSPHFIASLIAMLWLTMFWLRAISTGHQRWTLAAGTLALFWFWFHPFHIITVGALMALYTLYLYLMCHPDREHALWSATGIWFIASPALLYYVLLLNFDWLTILRSYQNINLSPRWWLMLTGFAGLIPLALIGWVRVVKQLRTHTARSRLQEHALRFCLMWLPLHWLVIYLPLNFQRRLTQGIHVITALFAWFGFAWLWHRRANLPPVLRTIAPTLAGIAIVFGLLFTTFGNWLTEFDVIAKKLPHIYLTGEEKAAFDWIKNNTRPEERILSHTFTATLIPAYTGRRVYAGHDVETAYAVCCKRGRTAWVLAANTPDEQRYTYLIEQRIAYILINTRTVYPLWTIADFDKKQYFTRVYSNNSINIYQVTAHDQRS